MTNAGAIQNVAAGGIAINASGVLAVGYTPDATLLGKIASGSSGVVALTAGASADIALPGTTFLGAAGGPVTYSGTLTTSDGNYRLGGGAASGSATVGTLTAAGNLTGGGSLTVGNFNGNSGVGTVVLSGTNTYAGGTTVNQFGTLRIDADARLGAAGTTLTLNNGTLQAGASFVSSRPIHLTSGSFLDTNGFDVTLSGPVTGSSTNNTLIKRGAGTLTLTGSATTNGSANVQGGTLRVDSDARLGAGIGIVILSGGGTLQASGTITTTRQLQITSVGGAVDTNGNDVTFGSLLVLQL